MMYPNGGGGIVQRGVGSIIHKGTGGIIQRRTGAGVRLELDNLAAFLKMAADYKKQIGFQGTLLLEPKPQVGPICAPLPLPGGRPQECTFCPVSY